VRRTVMYPSSRCPHWWMPGIGPRLFGPLVLVFLLAGCHTWRDERVGRSPLSLLEIDSPPGEGGSSYGEGHLPAGSWQEAGEDTLWVTVAQLRDWGVEHSPGVRVARAALAAAEARGEHAGRWPDPELSGRVIRPDGETSAEGALLFTLPLNGAAAAAGRVASRDAAQARVAVEAARFAALCDLDQILARLATAYIRAEVCEEVAARAAEYAELTRQRRDAGLADPLDLSLIMADAARDRRAALRSRDEVRAHKSDLRVLLGAARPIAVRPDEVKALLPGLTGELQPIVDGPLSAMDGPPPAADRPLSALDARLPGLDELLLRADRNRPDWKRAQLAYEKAEWEAVRAGRERIPNPVGGPAVTHDGERTSWGVSLGLSIPIFSNRGAAYREALSDRDQAYEAMRGQAHHATAEIERLYHHIGMLDEQLAATSGVPLAAAREARQLAHDRYEAGQVDVLLLLSAHRAYADLEREVLDLRLARHLARVDLERAVGAVPTWSGHADAENEGTTR